MTRIYHLTLRLKAASPENFLGRTEKLLKKICVLKKSLKSLRYLSLCTKSIDLTCATKSNQNKLNYNSAWNVYFPSAGHCVRQSTLRAGHSRLLQVICVWYTIEIWKPVCHCDRQKTNHVVHTWNRAGQWPMNVSYSCWLDLAIISDWFHSFHINLQSF